MGAEGGAWRVGWGVGVADRRGRGHVGREGGGKRSGFSLSPSSRDLHEAYRKVVSTSSLSSFSEYLCRYKRHSTIAQ